MTDYVCVTVGSKTGPDEALEGLFPDGLESSVLVDTEYWGQSVVYTFQVERKKRLDIWSGIR